MVSRQKAGKAFVTCKCRRDPVRAFAGGRRLVPLAAQGIQGRREAPVTCNSTSGATVLVPPATHVACASTLGRILTFEIAELKAMANGGRGLMLLDLETRTPGRRRRLHPLHPHRGPGPRWQGARGNTEIRSLNNARAVRGRKGKVADLGFKPQRITRVGVNTMTIPSQRHHPGAEIARGAVFEDLKLRRCAQDAIDLDMDLVERICKLNGWDFAKVQETPARW